MILYSREHLLSYVPQPWNKTKGTDMELNATDFLPPDIGFHHHHPMVASALLPSLQKWTRTVLLQMVTEVSDHWFILITFNNGHNPVNHEQSSHKRKIVIASLTSFTVSDKMHLANWKIGGGWCCKDKWKISRTNTKVGWYAKKKYINYQWPAWW